LRKRARQERKKENQEVLTRPFSGSSLYLVLARKLGGELKVEKRDLKGRLRFC